MFLTLPSELLPPRLAALRLIEEDSLPSILIVDDYPAVRSAIRAGLERYSGFLVCGEAVDGADAIEKATKLKPDFILLDLSMPRMNGMEAASILKRLMPNVLIVAFSMYAELLGRSLPSTLGIDAVIDKLAGIEKVVECARNLLGVAAT
jgi:DNA-binding NarL/FixJ family response regulator